MTSYNPTEQNRYPYYPIVVRRHKETREVLLFMRGGSKGDRTIYSFRTGFDISSHQFMIEQTRPVPTPSAEKYFDQFVNGDFHLETFVPVLRKQIK